MTVKTRQRAERCMKLLSFLLTSETHTHNQTGLTLNSNFQHLKCNTNVPNLLTCLPGANDKVMNIKAFSFQVCFGVFLLQLSQITLPQVNLSKIYLWRAIQNSFGEVPRNIGCRVGDKTGCKVVACGQNAHIRNEQFFGVAHLFMQSKRWKRWHDFRIKPSSQHANKFAEKI